MRVLFIADPDPREVPVGEHYEAGQIYDLRPDQAYRWMEYGRAVEAPPEPAPEPEDPAEVDPIDALAEANPEPEAATEVASAKPRKR